jgi:hypothetical protein
VQLSGGGGFEFSCARRDGRCGVRVGRVEGFGSEQRMGEVVELFAVFHEELGDFGVGVVDDPAHFLVDQPLRLWGGLACAGEQGPSVGGQNREGAEFSLIPQRATIERAIWVSCWRSDSAPVVTSP